MDEHELSKRPRSPIRTTTSVCSCDCSASKQTIRSRPLTAAQVGHTHRRLAVVQRNEGMVLVCPRDNWLGTLLVESGRAAFGRQSAEADIGSDARSRQSCAQVGCTEQFRQHPEADVRSANMSSAPTRSCYRRHLALDSRSAFVFPLFEVMKRPCARTACGARRRSMACRAACLSDWRSYHLCQIRCPTQ